MKFKHFCCLLILFFSYNQLSPFIFLANSDTHVGEKGIKEQRKVGHIQKMLEMNSSPLRPTFNLFIGDLTDHGYGEEKNSALCCFKPEIYYTKELNEFCTRWLFPLEETGVPIYLCAGNHDVYGKRTGITNFIKKRPGNTYYKFQKENVVFICCHIYPNKEIQKWLQNKILPTIPTHKPIIFFFHYPPTGKGSRSWPEEEKDSFFNTIQNHNVQALIVGHHGKFSYVSTWREKIPVYCVAGEYFAVFDIEERLLNVTFHSRNDFKDQNLMYYTPEELEYLTIPR